MRVYLIQHAKAKSKDEDPERPLTDEGRKDAERVAAFLADGAGLRVGHIVHSGKRRTRETAEVLAERLGGAEPEASEELKAMAEPSDWAGRLEKLTNEDVMLVGHMPHMARLAGRLLTGDEDREPVTFHNGGVVCLGRDENGKWALEWAVTPDLIAAP